MERRFFEALLDRKCNIAMVLSDRLVWRARRAETVGEPVAEEAAVAALAVEDELGVELHAIWSQLKELLDHLAQRRIQMTVRCQPHQLDFPLVRIPAKVFGRGAVEPSERVGESDVTYLTQ